MFKEKVFFYIFCQNCILFFFIIICEITFLLVQNFKCSVLEISTYTFLELFPFISGCNGFFDKAPGCPHENPHFEPIIPEAKGYGKGNGEMHDDKMNFNFTIGDNLQIPGNT